MFEREIQDFFFHKLYTKTRKELPFLITIYIGLLLKFIITHAHSPTGSAHGLPPRSSPFEYLLFQVSNFTWKVLIELKREQS